MLARSTLLRAVPVAAVAVLLAGCSVMSGGAQSSDQTILSACPPDAKVAADVEWDGSGSSASSAIADTRLAIVADVARRAAICDGHLIVRVFSASSGATATVFDGDLHLPGATDNARLRRVDQLVSDTMASISGKLPQALASLPGGGSDITSVYRLGSEYAAQLGDGYKLHLYVLTDGLNNIGVSLDSQVLSPEQATGLANQVAVPTLPTDASVTVAGLGQIDGAPVPSALVEGLVVFYDALCHKTGAATCVSVTDYQAGK